ncbi:tubulin epsilon and delta complex protein 1-like isoform X2 [Actinia tenebrosa]|uniref:Tubulin epsilon and delta complex protein 1-like isoform X2 n=1 Tax=Actinia tenebrosa TaxID=6105 RepID=A0A6P8I644_ACTTE|nr:tubulin epsilon and delta complex protein 1-like isoform X2 [Actinia tenebrosa]
MTQIRETIESLCVVLKYNGIAEITAETFRQAKFDNQDTTKPMWFTLKNLILWLEMTKDGITVDFNREHGNISEELPGLVRYCKHGMFSIGYRVRSFFALPENMEKLNGSREILLAIGWLMAKENLIKKFATRVKRIISEDLPFKKSCCAGVSLTENALFSTSHSRVTNENERLLRLIEEIILIKGKINAAFRSLLAAKNEYSCVLNRIHKATLPFPQKSPSSSSHLSAIDVYLLYHEKELIRHQERLEHENVYLKSLIFLMDKESSFWKWMESTLDAKLRRNEDSEEDEIQESWMGTTWMK